MRAAALTCKPLTYVRWSYSSLCTLTQSIHQTQKLLRSVEDHPLYTTWCPGCNKEQACEHVVSESAALQSLLIKHIADVYSVWARTPIPKEHFLKNNICLHRSTNVEEIPVRRSNRALLVDTQDVLNICSSDLIVKIRLMWLSAGGWLHTEKTAARSTALLLNTDRFGFVLVFQSY